MEYNVDNADAKITFIDVVLGFMQMKNADVYVTGSNSKMNIKEINVAGLLYLWWYAACHYTLT